MLLIEQAFLGHTPIDISVTGNIFMATKCSSIPMLPWHNKEEKF